MPGRAKDAADLFDHGEYAAALRVYDDLALGAPDHRLLVNRGYCHVMLGDAAAAARDFQSALEVEPRCAEACVGLGDLAAAAASHEEAIRHYDGALARSGGLAVARNNRSHSLTALGRLREAWRDGESRYELTDTRSLYPHHIDLPRWDGSPGRNVLVHWEQGFGDIIQHLRFLPLVAERVRAAAFECPPPLARLARRLPGTVSVIEARHSAPDTDGFDACAPLASLPHLLGVDPDRLPSPPYLLADAAAAAARRAAWLGGEKRAFGIVWRASSFDPRRSLPLAELAALRLPGVRLVSLQPDATPEEHELLLSSGVVDAGSAFRDFDDTAAALAAVDHVVCVDTAVAHLAGALARPASVLLNEPAAVRWMIGREDTPWYPGMRLLRKATGEPWSRIVSKAASRLAEGPQP